MRLILRTSFALMVFILLLLEVQTSSAFVPSRQARFITFSDVQANQMTIDWVKGNGDGVIVLVREGDIPPVVSSLGNDYTLTATADADFSNAGVEGSTSSKLVGNIVGSTSTLTVTGLSANKKYQVMVLEYNTDGSKIDVNNSTASFNPRWKKTYPLTLGPPTALSCFAQTATTASITWTDGPNAAGYYLDVQYDKDYLTEYDLLDIGDNVPDVFLITGLTTPNTTGGKYRFRLRSYDTMGNVSAATAWITFDTQVYDPTVSTYDGVDRSATVCGLTFSLSATISTNSGYNPSPATGTWTVMDQPSGGTASFTPDIYSLTPSVTVSEFGTYVFEVTIAVGAYYESDIYTVNFADVPSANAGNDDVACGTPRTYTLSGSTLSGGATGSWTYVTGPLGGTATFGNTTSPTSTASVNMDGAFTFRWNIAAGTCTDNDDVVITYQPAATTSSAGPDDTHCGLVNYTLAGSTPSGGSTGTWSQTSAPPGGTATFANSNLGGSNVSVNVAGTYTFKWLISNGSCTSSDNVDITFYVAPTTATVTQATESVCGYTLTLDGNTPTVGTGTWSFGTGPSGGTYSFSPDANTPNASVTVDRQGSWSFAWTIGNGTCTPSSIAKVIYFYDTPTTADAGDDANATCGSLTYTLQGNTASVGTGSWTQVTGIGTASFATTTDPNAIATIPTFSGNSTDYTFAWTISNGTCTASSDSVVITYYNSPTTATVTQLTEGVCGYTLANLDGNNPTVGTGTWSQVSAPPGAGTASFGDPNSYNTSVTVDTHGLWSFAWTIGNGPCSTSAAGKQITFYGNPTTASAGIDQSVCSTSATLAGNTPTVGTGSWTQVTGIGTASFATTTSPAAGVTVPTFAGDSTLYTFRWTISNGTCTASTDDVDIKFFNSPTTATVGSTMDSTCGLSYTMDGNTPTVGTGSWAYVSVPPPSYNGGCGTASFDDPNDPQTIVYVTKGCTYHFTWTISNGVCTPSTTDKYVTFYETPTVASAGIDGAECGYTYTLAGNSPSSGTGSWTVVTGPIGGTASFVDPTSNSSQVTVDVLGSYLFEWTISNGICTPSTDDVEINFKSPAVADAGIDAYGCFPQYIMTAANPTPATGVWSMISGPSGGTATFGSTSSPNSTVDVNKLGTYKFSWEVNNGTCTKADTVVIIFVNKVLFTGQVINGSKNVSAGTSNVEYSVPSLDGAVGYTWTYLPATGVTIQGSGTNSFANATNVIKIDFGLNATTGTGILSLTPFGLCGPGNTIYDTITVNNKPIILTGTLDNGLPSFNPNRWIEITTNYDVYTNNDGTGDLLTTDFQLIFVKNSGTATGAVLDSVRMNGNRKTWKLYIHTTGPNPNGCETVEAKPLANQVYNWVSSVATAMANTETSGVKTLFNQNQPTTAASALVIPADSIYSSLMKVRWTNGNGTKRIVVASKNAPVIAPTDFTNYTPNPQFGAGSTTAANNYVVYNGAGSSVIVTGLDSNTTYNFQVFEYNQACGTANYTVTGATGSATTKPTATKLVVTSKPTLIISGVPFSITVQAQDAAGNPRNPLCDETITLVADSSGTFIGNTGVIGTTSNSVTLSVVKYTKADGGLGVTFTADDSGCGLDLASGNFSVNVRPEDPTIQAKNVYFGDANKDSIQLTWTKGNGNGRILTVKKVVNNDKVPNDILTDGMDLSTITTNKDTAIYYTKGKKITYAATNPVRTDSSFVVFRTYNNTTQDTVIIRDLDSSTQYSFRITEFKHAPLGANVWETYNYRTVTAGEVLNPRTKKSGGLGKLGSYKGIEIADFYGRSYDAKAELNWEAITENGLTGYEIYRMNPELSDEYVKVGNVDVKTAVGGSNYYKLIDNDNSLQVGNEYYYKLVAIGFDGQRHDISEVALTILTMPDNNLSLYISDINPNPVKDVVRFNVQTASSAPVVIEIRNLIGQVIYTEERTINGIQNFEFSMTAKAAGKYLITATSGQEAVLTTFVLVP